MQQHILPLFPLQVVLFPRTPLPLHIFEDRYKQMIGEVLDEKSEFGVVLAGEKGICNTGCTATVEKILERYPDGRLDLIAVGRRRFEILALDDEKPYLRGNVQFFDDEEFEPASDEAVRQALDYYKDIPQEEAETQPEAGDPQLSFRIANAVTDLNFRQTLLAIRSESDRIKQLVEFLPGFTSKQRQIHHVRNVAPRNGHTKWPAGL